jgi:glycosyltransferase involved in cell wall biosynthesis
MQQKAPLVTIGMPVFNGESYLERSIDAILAQTYQNFELVISDNASTDRTESICRAYAAKNPEIKYFRNEVNIGGFANHNKLIELGSGDYLMLTGHDDLRHPEQISRCLQVLEENPQYVMSYVATTYIGENDEVLDIKETPLELDSPKVETRFREIFRRDHKIEPIYGLIRYSALSGIRFGLYPDSDRVFIAELGLMGPFFRIPEPLFFRRDHAQSMTRKYNSRYNYEQPSRPDGSARFLFPFLRQGVKYVTAIFRSQLSLMDKARCYRQMGTWVVLYRRQLIGDTKHFLLTIIPRPWTDKLKRVIRRRTQ